MKRPTMPPRKPTGMKTASSDMRRRHDREADLARALDRRLERRHALLFDEAVDVLEHDDRVVDDDADHQREREHRHLVEREAERGDDGERADDRRRDRDRGDERRAEVPEEDQDDDGGQNAAEHEVLLDGRQRGVDELRVVAHQPDLDVRRQRRLDLRHARLDRVRERDGVVRRSACGRRRVTAGRPSSIETEFGSAPVSSTRPMSRMRIGVVAARRDDEIVEVVRRREAADASGPTARARPVRACRPGSSRFCDRSAAATSVVDKPYALRRSGSIWTWISRRRAPNSRTSPTPLTDSSRFCTFCSTIRRQLDDGHRRRDREHDDRERNPDPASARPADRAVSGRSRMTGSTLARTSCAAMSAFFEQVERDRHARAALGRRRAQLVDAGDGVHRGLDAIRDLGLDVLGRGAEVRWS